MTKQHWIGRPSQLENFQTFAMAILSSVLLYPILFMSQKNGPMFFILCSVIVILFCYAAWDYLVTKNTVYSFTDEVLIVKEGVLNETEDPLELYRVKDCRLEMPLLLRAFNLGNIILVTSDRTHPILKIKAIKNSREVMNDIRKFSEECRVKKGVREFD